MELNELELVKSTLNDVHRWKRTVEKWNEIREQLKKQYSSETISELDASGFIKEWLQ